MARRITRRRFLESTAVGITGSAIANAGELPKPKKEKSTVPPEKGSTVERASSPHQDIRHYATIEAYADGEPVYAFGYTYVYGLCPDLQPSVRLQEGNKRPWRKIRPKKSWELKGHKFGSTPAREPKTAWNDDQPLLCVHLIDGDPETAWCSRGQVQPDVEPVWIRIDLPLESRITSVVLVPHPKGMGKLGSGGPAGQAFPRQLEIRLSRDGWHWETVFANRNFPPPDPMKPQEFRFQPRLAKQIWIIGNECTPVMNFGHCFSISEVEVRDEEGNNLALISRGAGVTVSSTHTGYGMDRYTQDMLWPIQYDLGFKWLRVGYDMGVFLWAYVEREKGKLKVDTRADAAITEAVANGIKVIMCLDKGNWLYAPQPKKKDRTRELMETYYDRPPEPTEGDEAYLQGYLNYVRYMVRHFKDRVRYFEIMNEWSRPVEEYVRLAKATIPVIREEYPEAKILAVSTGGFDRKFILGYLKLGLGPLIDVIPWHPWYQTDPVQPEYISYAQDVRDLKKQCESLGFKGEYMATEWTWSAPYPPATATNTHDDPNPFVITEMQKAKYALGLNIEHAGLDMVSLWNETFQEHMTDWSIGLTRNTFGADPIPPTQPEPVYYVLRTLCTAMDEFQPADFVVRYSAKGDFESWTFAREGGEKLLAFWKRGRAPDISDGTLADVTLVGQKVTRAVGIDLINGREQELDFVQEGNNVVLRGMLVQDFPALVRFS
jgi:hypothetical protein